LQSFSRPLTEAEQRVADGRLSVFAGLKHPDPFLRPGALRGQRYILIDRWGPYDFKSPRFCPRETLAGAPAGTTRRRFELLGPGGKWRVLTKSGVSGLSKSSGIVPGFVDVDIPTGSKPVLELEYIGGRTVDYRGIPSAAGRAVRFEYKSE